VQIAREDGVLQYRDATVTRVLFTPVLFTQEGCEELAARVWGAVESPGSLREAGNN
jgi:5,10-methenyltetrahydromethanopterin hydrogenase